MMAPLAPSKAAVPAKYRNPLLRRRFEGIVSLLRQITRRKNVGAEKAGVCVREAGYSLPSLLRVLIESLPSHCADTFPSYFAHEKVTIMALSAQLVFERRPQLQDRP